MYNKYEYVKFNGINRGIHSGKSAIHGKMHGEAINAYGNIMGIVLAGLPHLVTG